VERVSLDDSDTADEDRGGLWSKLPVWARPPTLPDFEANERARLLWLLMGALLLVLVPLSLVGLFFGKGSVALTAGIYAIPLAFTLGCLSLIRRGRILAAGILYVTCHWLLVATLVVFLGGISEMHTSGFVIVTMLSGLTIGARAGLSTAGLSIAAVVAIGLLENAGSLPRSPMPMGLLEDATSLLANITIAALFVALSVSGLTRAARREQQIAARYRALADQRAGLGALGQFAVTAPSAERLAEEAATTTAKALGAKAVILYHVDDGGPHILAAWGVETVAVDLATKLNGNTDAALLPGGLPGFLPAGVVARAPIPGRQKTRGGVVVVLAGSAPVGAVAFVESVGALIGSALDRDEAQRQFRQAQKMEVVGRLAGGVAHDFNNLLAAILMSAEMLVDELADGDERQLARDVVTASERAALLTRQLLAFSRKQTLTPEPIDLARLLRDFLPVLQRLLRADIQVEIDASEKETTILADRSSVEQVLLNLAVNARDAMPAGGRLLLSARSTGTTDDGAGWAVLSVRDTGQGMSKETLEHVFEPFFTTKSDGTGLGLATVLDIVKRSNGRVEVRSEEGVGTTFDVFFPNHRGAVDVVAAPSPRETPRGRELLLVVDDEPAVRAVTRRILERAGYQVLEAASAAEALVRLEAQPGVVLVLSDVVMPVRSGIELAADVAKSGKRVLLLSGYAEGLRSDAPWPFLAKPYASVDLLAKVRELLDEPASAPAE